MQLERSTVDTELIANPSSAGWAYIDGRRDIPGVVAQVRATGRAMTLGPETAEAVAGWMEHWMEAGPGTGDPLASSGLTMPESRVVSGDGFGQRMAPTVEALNTLAQAAEDIGSRHGDLPARVEGDGHSRGKVRY